MNNYKVTLTAIATACFSIVILAYQWIQVNLPASSNAIIQQAILYFASVGFYVLIFRTSVLIYSRLLYRPLNRKSNIHGKWHYIQQISHNNSVRTGYCEISHEEDQILISGTGFEENSTLMSNRWQSESATIQGRQLIIAFESIGTRTNHTVRKGLILANLQEKPPQIMYGYWTDIMPNESSGTITLYKNKEEFNIALKTYNSSIV